MRISMLVIAFVAMSLCSGMSRADAPTEQTWASAVDRSNGTWVWLDPESKQPIFRVEARWIQPRKRMSWSWEGTESAGSALLEWDSKLGKAVAGY